MKISPEWLKGIRWTLLKSYNQGVETDYQLDGPLRFYIAPSHLDPPSKCMTWAPCTQTLEDENPFYKLSHLYPWNVLSFIKADPSLCSDLGTSSAYAHTSSPSQNDLCCSNVISSSHASCNFWSGKRLLAEQPNGMRQVKRSTWKISLKYSRHWLSLIHSDWPLAGVRSWAWKGEANSIVQPKSNASKIPRSSLNSSHV